jgi:hypothetical protein
MIFFRTLASGCKEAISANALRTITKGGATYQVERVTIERANQIALMNFNARVREINAQLAAIRKAEKIDLGKSSSE